MISMDSPVVRKMMMQLSAVSDQLKVRRERQRD